MSERRRAPRVSRLHVPDRSLWTPEAAELYLKDDGSLNLDKDGNPNFLPRPVPTISPDNPVVDIPAFAADINSLFVSGAFSDIYLKRRVYIDHIDGMDVTTVVVIPVPLCEDIDHVQGLENYMKDGKKLDALGFSFCDSAERQMEIHREQHIVRTELYPSIPEVPHDIIRSHMTGHRLCLNLYKAALLCVNRGYGFTNRAESIMSGAVEPKNYDSTKLHEAQTYADIIDAEASRYFKKRSQKYRGAVNREKDKLLENMPDDSYFRAAGIEAVESRPARIVNILSKVATDQPWAYADFIRGRVDLQTAQNTHKNRIEQRVAREALLRA